MDAEEIAHLQRLRDQYERNVWRLKEQAAEHGLDVPLDITNGIEEFEAQIAQINKQLEQAQREVAAAPVAAAPVMASVATTTAGAPAPSSSAVQATSANPPAAYPTRLPTTPRYLVLYTGVIMLLVGVILSPFVGPVDSTSSFITGLFIVFGLALTVGVLGFMVWQRFGQRGK